MANDYGSPGKSSDRLDDLDSEWPPLERQKVNSTKNRTKDKDNRKELPVNIAVQNKWEDRRSNLPPRLRNQKSGRKFGKNNYQNNDRNASNSEGSMPPITLPKMTQRVPLIPPLPMLPPVPQIPPPTMLPRVPLIPPPMMMQQVPLIPPPTMPPRVPLIPPPTMPQQVPLISPPMMPQQVPPIPPPMMPQQVPPIPPPMMPQQVPPIPSPMMPQQVPPIPPPMMPQQVPLISPPMMPQQVPFISPPTMSQQMPFIPPQTMQWQTQPIPTLATGQVPHSMVYLPPNPSQMMYFDHCTLMFDRQNSTARSGSETSSPCATSPTFTRPPRPFLELKDTTEKRKFHIMRQIQFYFRSKKMLSDSFFLQNMDAEGFVPISLIASFPKVKEQTREISLIMEALKLSEILEVVGDKVRLKDVPKTSGQPSTGIVNQAESNAYDPSPQLETFPPVPCNAQFSDQQLYFPQDYEYQNCVPSSESNSSVSYPRNSAEFNGSYPPLIHQTSISNQCSVTVNQAEPSVFSPSTQLTTFAPGPSQSSGQTDCFPNNYDYQNYVPVSESNNIVYNPDTSCVINGVWYPPLSYRLKFSTSPIQYGLTPSTVNFQTYPASVSNFNLPTNSNEPE